MKIALSRARSTLSCPLTRLLRVMTSGKAGSHRTVKNVLLAMKLTGFLILVACLHVSANGVGQNVTLSVKNASLEKVFTEIILQSGTTIIYDDISLKNARPVTINVENASVEQVLNVCLKGQPFSYTKEEGLIYIKPTPLTDDLNRRLGEPHFSAADNPPVSGVIRDSDGNPLSGVNIVVKGTKRGVVSDAYGNFNIEANTGDVLIISSIGFNSKEIKISSTNVPLIVQLQRNISQLDEVIINKGYYSTSRSLNTGSTGKISGETISKQPVGNLMQALEGRVAGLYIYQTSGVPGAAVQVNIRGRNSIANGTAPLYIVDGVPFNTSQLNQNQNAAYNWEQSPLQNIRPEDVENIEILKDADATAIYGSRGANGVILITTKKGKAGKTKFNINYTSGQGKVTNKLDLMSTQQYLQMRKEAYVNDALPVPDVSSTPDYSNYDLTSWSQNKNTDWQNFFIGGSSHITNATAAISGGNAQTRFIFSSSYRKETTVYPGDFSSSIYSGVLNVHHTSENARFTADFNVNYANTKNKLPILDFTKFTRLAPNAPDLYLANGELNWENGTFDNPAANIQQKSVASSDNFIGNALLAYTLLPGLQIKSNIGYTRTSNEDVNTIPYSSVNPSWYANPADARALTQAFNRRNSWIMEPQLSYSNHFGLHTIDVLAGSTFQESRQKGLQQQGTGFSSDLLLENIQAAANVFTLSANNILYKYTAFFARIGYNYNEKYLFNITGRRDGSSRFGPGNRFGNFGAVGVGWIFSKENFVSENISFLSFGKLRASIGKTGNDQIQDYAYLGRYYSSSPTYLGVTTLNLGSLTNPDYHWETINKTEIGLELGFLKDKLLVNANYYRNRTDNQLVGYSLPNVTGYNTIIANLPAVIQNKGFELDATSKNINNKNFSWTTSANISFPENKLVSYPNIEGSSYHLVYAVGQALSSQYVYKFTGLDQQTGLYTFEDLDKDGSIESTNDKYSKFIGQKFYGGINNSFSYKDFSLDIFFQFVKQTGFNSTVDESPGSFYAYGTNQPSYVFDRWQGAGDPGPFQRYSTKYEDAYYTNQYYYSSDASIVDASFIRLKNIQAAWTMPEKWQKQLRIQSLKFYVQAQNLLTLTNFKGIDPEIAQYKVGNILPTLKTIVAGVQLGL